MKRREWLAMSDMVIICEKMKWLWRKTDLERIRQAHFEKMNVFEIAEMMQEDPDDVALALFHLSQEGKLRKSARRWR